MNLNTESILTSATEVLERLPLLPLWGRLAISTDTMHDPGVAQAVYTLLKTGRARRFLRRATPPTYGNKENYQRGGGTFCTVVVRVDPEAMVRFENWIKKL